MGNFLINVYSPLEQFYIIPLFEIDLGFFDFCVTNEMVALLLIFVFIVTLFNALCKPDTNSFYAVPTIPQLILLYSYRVIASLVKSNIGLKNGQKYFPIFFALFWYIVLLNVSGLIPFNFTLTSHIIVTLALSFSLFFLFNIAGFRKHNFKLFSLFFPQGTTFSVSILLVPIELLSYLFRPISLSIRLFANMMAGHTLLKVLSIFAWTIAHAAGFTMVLYFVPCLILIPLFALEFFIALLQAYIFVLLATSYLGDALNLH